MAPPHWAAMQWDDKVRRHSHWWLAKNGRNLPLFCYYVNHVAAVKSPKFYMHLLCKIQLKVSSWLLWIQSHSNEYDTQLKNTMQIIGIVIIIFIILAVNVFVVNMQNNEIVSRQHKTAHCLVTRCNTEMIGDSKHSCTLHTNQGMLPTPLQSVETFLYKWMHPLSDLMHTLYVQYSSMVALRTININKFNDGLYTYSR